MLEKLFNEEIFEGENIISTAAKLLIGMVFPPYGVYNLFCIQVEHELEIKKLNLESKLNEARTEICMEELDIQEHYSEEIES